ncbi:MAG TPA: hypothetical protein VEL06_13400 [Haliangiales bacterium]|nr:hypothetical protein [Haliangiales bacterium]
MSAPDSDQGSTRRKSSWFTTTHWSVVLAAGQEPSPEAQEALEKLCRTYWFPLYAYVRRKGHNPEDAQDLTQAFFAAFLRKDSISQAWRRVVKTLRLLWPLPRSRRCHRRSARYCPTAIYSSPSPQGVRAGVYDS